MKHWAVLLAATLLVACATTPAPPSPDQLFNDAWFAAPAARVSSADVFAVSPEMRRYLDTEIAAELVKKGRQQGLFDALYSRSQLRLEYESDMTRNAAEAFAARSGNCLSLVIMTAAFAKELGLTVRYRQAYADETWSRAGDLYLSVGHVNLTLGNANRGIKSSLYDVDLLTIDFLPPAEVRGLHTRVIDEKAIVAMYMNNRAVESMALRRLDDAYWWARAAIAQDPASPSAYNTLGAIYQRHGDLAQAAQVLSYALERDPKNTRAMSNLVTVLTALGRVAEATELARKLERLDPDPPFSFFDRGLAAMQKGDYRAAKEMFAREVRRAPYYHEFHFWLAAACVGLGEFDQAREEMTIALESSTKRSDRDLYAAKLDRITSHRGQ